MSTTKKKFVLPKSAGIPLVIFCSILAYSITKTFILHNIIQYSKLPHTMEISVCNGMNKEDRSKFTKSDSTRFSLPVKSLLAIDSTQNNISNYSNTATAHNILFNQNPAFLIWIFLVCAMISIAAGSAPFFILHIDELRKQFNLSWRKVLIGGVSYAVLLDAFLIYTNEGSVGYFNPRYIIDHFGILLQDGSILYKLVVATLILIFPAFCTLALIGLSSDSLYNIVKKKGEEDVDIKNSIEEGIKRISYLNQLLQSTLRVMAVIVVFSVLTTTMLGESIRATIHVQNMNLFPKQMGYVYGMYFTLFLCIIYIPVHYYLKYNYAKLKEFAVDQIGISDSSVYTKLLENIKFEGTALDNLKLALTIIAPIISSFLPNTFEFFK